MGNFLFAALGLRLHPFEVEGALHFTFTFDAKPEFLYVVDPMDWEAIPYTATRLQGHGIVMRQSAAQMPLMRHSLRQELHSITEDDITECLKRLDIELTPPNNKTSDMFLALAKHFCGAEYAQVEADMYEKSYAA